MKKLIVVWFFVALIFVSAFGTFAEGFDLDSMSEYDLLELLFEVQEKIYTRNEFSDFVVFSGNYEVGVNFDPGTYVFKVLKQTDSGTPAISVYNSSDNLNPSNRISFDLFRDIENAKFQYTFTEGQCLEFANADFQSFRR